MVSAGIPCTKELLGLSRSDGKRPNGLSLVPWEAGKPLTWDVTVIYPLADSYVAAAAREAGSAAKEAATRKTAKYSNIQAYHIFQPVAVELFGPIAFSFLNSVASLVISRATTKNQLFILATLSSDLKSLAPRTVHVCHRRVSGCRQTSEAAY